MRLAPFNIFVRYSIDKVKNLLSKEHNIIVCTDYHGIDNVRELITKSYCLANPTVFILADADKMTLQAQNGLLKLAEEPPDKAVIVLLVDSIHKIHKLLPTIKSRACVFSDNTVEDEILIEEIEALAKKVFDNLSTVNYVNLLVVINHIHEEQYRAFMLALERLWRKETERYNEYKLICKYIQDIRSSTNMTRHLRTLLQELKELRQ